MSNYDLNSEVKKAVKGLGFLEADKKIDGEMTISNRRRRRRIPPQDESIVSVTLTRDDEGVLRWEEGLIPFSRPGRRMRRGPGAVTSGETVEQFKFEKLRQNEIGQMLESLDRQLTPNMGQSRGKLRRVKFNNDQVIWEDLEQPSAVNDKQKILVFIHGTFSSNDHVIGQEIAAPTNNAGKAMLNLLANGPNKPYDEVLAFDHPTLSVSPMLNALDLSRLFANTQAQVDVICHSRGGLVARWWLEVFERNAKPGKVVMVGSPLGGTSLADPTRLRSSIQFLANISNAVGSTIGFSFGNPFMTISASLFKLISSLGSLTAKTPLIDAAIAMVPGLAAQSRVGNNFELRRLRTIHDRLPIYYAVKSNFQPKTIDAWKFWKFFVDKPLLRAANAGVDFIFGRDEKGTLEIENDLVVNTRSMTELFGNEEDNKKFKGVLDFAKKKASEEGHHVNYFQQAETIKFIRESLWEKDKEKAG